MDLHTRNAFPFFACLIMYDSGCTLFASTHSSFTYRDACKQRGAMLIAVTSTPALSNAPACMRVPDPALNRLNTATGKACPLGGRFPVMLLAHFCSRQLPTLAWQVCHYAG